MNLLKWAKAGFLSANARFGWLYPAELQVIRVYNVRGVKLKIASNNRKMVWRWEQMAAGTKEPETLDWIDRCMRPEDVMVDIGACVGNYSLYAAARHRGLKVYAFEPEPNSLVDLVQNATLNELPVTFFSIPLNENKMPDFFNCNPIYCRDDETGRVGRDCFIAGESNHQFGRLVKSHGASLQPSVRIGMCSCSIDEIIQRKLIPTPHHVKIDVDGLEPQIIKGMTKLISGATLRSLLCEVQNEEENKNLSKIMAEAGFRCTWRSPVRRNQIFERQG